jgi:hypothetical protein
MTWTLAKLGYTRGADWLTGWDNRLKLTIDHTKIDSTLSQFPVMLRLSASCGAGSADMTRVFDDLGANSLKIAVTSDDGLTQLYVEVEKWDSTNEEVILWVSKSGWTLSSTADTVLYLYYDYNHADNPTYVGVPGSTPGQAVWDSSHKRVDHMQDDPDVNHTTDSSASNYDGSKSPYANGSIETAGKLGEAQNFDNIDDKIIHTAINVADGGEFTVEFIARPDVVESAMQSVFGDTANASSIRFFKSGTDRRIYIYNFSGGEYQWFEVGEFNLENHHWAIVFSSTRVITVYKDGTAVATRTYTNDQFRFATIGYSYGSNTYYKGWLDEVRHSSSARAAAWIKAAYYSAWDTLVTFAVETYNGLAGGRIYFVTAPQSVAKPYLVINKISGVREHSHDGSSHLAHPRFQFSAFGTTYQGVKEILAALQAVLQGYKGTMGGASGVAVGAAIYEDETDLYEEGTGLFGAAADYIIWHYE